MLMIEQSKRHTWNWLENGIPYFNHYFIHKSKDKNPDNVEAATEKFKVIGEAYSVLKDKDKRSKYD